MIFKYCIKKKHKLQKKFHPNESAEYHTFQFTKSDRHPHPLKENWAWAKKENGLFFTFVDADVFAIRCYLQVHLNMAVTVEFFFYIAKHF